MGRNTVRQSGNAKNRVAQTSAGLSAEIIKLSLQRGVSYPR